MIEPGLAGPLTVENTRGILPKGGTILGTSNKANPFQYAVLEQGRYVEKDLSHIALERYRELGLDGLIAVGGGGPLSIAHRLGQPGLEGVGCPKTNDKQLHRAVVALGFAHAPA